MPFDPNEHFYDAELTLPVQGHSYTVQSPNAHTGKLIQRLVVIGQRASQNEDLTDEEKEFLETIPDGEQLDRLVLSDQVYDAMMADGVNWAWFQRAVGTVMHWVAIGRVAAEEFWKAGGEAPKAAAPQDRLPAKKSTRPRSASSPRKMSGNPAKKAAATAGGSSSTTGRSSKPTSTSSTG